MRVLLILLPLIALFTGRAIAQSPRIGLTLAPSPESKIPCWISDPENCWTKEQVIPGFFGNNTAGADISFYSGVGSKPSTDMFVTFIRSRPGKNGIYYRIGKNVRRTKKGAFFMADGWSAVHAVPKWVGERTSGGGIAVADISGDGKRDVVILNVNVSPGRNAAYYRVGFNVNGEGTVKGHWSPVFKVPHSMGTHTVDSAIAIGTLCSKDSTDIVVAHVEKLRGRNEMYYNIGCHFRHDGTIGGGWLGKKKVYRWVGYDTDGVGVEITDIDRNGKPDIALYHLNERAGKSNHAYFRVGLNVDVKGNVEKWTSVRTIPGGFKGRNGGGGLASTQLADGTKVIAVMYVESREGYNRGYLRYAAR